MPRSSSEAHTPDRAFHLGREPRSCGLSEITQDAGSVPSPRSWLRAPISRFRRMRAIFSPCGRRLAKATPFLRRRGQSTIGMTRGTVCNSEKTRTPDRPHRPEPEKGADSCQAPDRGCSQTDCDSLHLAHPLRSRDRGSRPLQSRDRGARVGEPKLRPS